MKKDSSKREDRQGKWDRHWPGFSEGDFYLFAYFLKQMAFYVSLPQSSGFRITKVNECLKWE